MRVLLAHGKSYGSCLASAAGSTGSLKIIGGMRRHVVHADNGNATYVYAHLHGRGTGEDINVTRFEFIRTLFEFVRCQLGRMFLSNEIWCEFYDMIVRGRPKATIAKVADPFVFGEPCTGLT